MNVELSNGMTVSGTPEQIKTVIQALGLKDRIPGVYNSSTKGTVFIKDMNSSHIRNAMLKLGKDHIEQARTFNDRQFIELFDIPLVLTDSTIRELRDELNNRLHTEESDAYYDSEVDAFVDFWRGAV